MCSFSKDRAAGQASGLHGEDVKDGDKLGEEEYWRMLWSRMRGNAVAELKIN